MSSDLLLKEHFFDTRDELVRALTDTCVATLEGALTTRANASLMVSGGSTPEPLYAALAQSRLSWERVTVALVDERWVDTNHSASNEEFVKRALLHDTAAQAKFVGMKSEAATALAGVEQVNGRYDGVPSPFDLLILGMGPDGHTASLFPAAVGLEHALDANNRELCCAISAQQSAVTGEYTERMTLTLHGILRARQIVLLITGEEKLAIYRQALRNASYNRMPVSAVLQQQQTPVAVYWAP